MPAATGTWAELKDYDSSYTLNVVDTVTNVLNAIGSFNNNVATVTLTKKNLTMMQFTANIVNALLIFSKYSNRFISAYASIIITDTIANFVKGSDELLRLKVTNPGVPSMRTLAPLIRVVDTASNFLSSYQSLVNLTRVQNTTVIVTDTIQQLTSAVAAQVNTAFETLDERITKLLAYNDTVQNYKTLTDTSIYTTTNTISDSVSNLTASSNYDWLSTNSGVYFINVLGNTTTVNSSNILMLKTGATDDSKDGNARITIKDTAQNIISSIDMIAPFGCDAFISDSANSIIAKTSDINTNKPYIAGVTSTDRALTSAEKEIFAFATYIEFIPASSPPPPISNTCFVKDTMVCSDQGWVKIQELRESVHTFGGHELVALTKTVSLDDHLVEFEANCFAPSVPLHNIKTTANHALLVNGVMKKAKEFKEGKQIPYTGEPLYNILLNIHGIVNVEGVACETLHPSNSVAHLFRHKLTDAAVEHWNRITVEEFTGSKTVSIVDYGDNFFDVSGTYLLPRNLTATYMYGGTITANNCTVAQSNSIFDHNHKDDITRVNIVDYGFSYVDASNAVIRFPSKTATSIAKTTNTINKISVLGFSNFIDYVNPTSTAASNIKNVIIYDTAANLTSKAAFLLTHAAKIAGIVNSDGGALALDASLSSKIKTKYTAGMDWSAAPLDSVFYHETRETFSANVDALVSNADKIFRMMVVDPLNSQPVTMTVPQASALIGKILDRKLVRVQDMVSDAVNSSLFSTNVSVLYSIEVNAIMTMTAPQAYDLCRIIPDFSARIVDTYVNFTARYNGDASIRFRLSRNLAKIYTITLSSCNVAGYQSVSNVFLDKLIVEIIDTASNLSQLTADSSQIAAISVGSLASPDSTMQVNIASVLLYVSKITNIYAQNPVRLTVSEATILSSKFDRRMIMIVDVLPNVNSDLKNLSNILSLTIHGNAAAATQYLATTLPFVANFVAVDSYANLLPITNKDIKLVVNVTGVTDAAVNAFLLLHRSKTLALYRSDTVFLFSFQYEYVTETIIGDQNVMMGNEEYPINVRESTYLFAKLGLTPSKILGIYSKFATSLSEAQYPLLLEKFTDGKVYIGNEALKISLASLELNLTNIVQNASKIRSIYPATYITVNTFSKASLLADKVNGESKIRVFSSSNALEFRQDIENNLNRYLLIVANIYEFMSADAPTMTSAQQVVTLIPKFRSGVNVGSETNRISGVQGTLDTLLIHVSKIKIVYPSEPVTMNAAQATSLAAKFSANSIIVQSSGVDIAFLLTTLTLSTASKIVRFDTTDRVTLTVAQAETLSSKFPDDSIIVEDTAAFLTSSVLTAYASNPKILSVTVLDTVFTTDTLNRFIGVAKVTAKIVRGTRAILSNSVLATYQANAQITGIILADSMTVLKGINLASITAAYPKLTITVGASLSSTANLVSDDVPYLVSNIAYIATVFSTSIITMTAPQFLSIYSKFPFSRIQIGDVLLPVPLESGIEANLSLLFRQISKIYYFNVKSPIRLTCLEASLYASYFPLTTVLVGSAENPDNFVQQYIPGFIANAYKFAAVYAVGVVTLTAAQAFFAQKFPNNLVSIGTLSNPSPFVYNNLASLIANASKIENIFPTETVSLTLEQALVLAPKFPANSISLGSFLQSTPITTANLVFLLTNRIKFTNFFTSSIVTLPSTTYLPIVPIFYDDNLLTLGAIDLPVAGVQTILPGAVASASKFQSIYPDTPVTLTSAEADALASKIPPTDRRTLTNLNVVQNLGTLSFTWDGAIVAEDRISDNGVPLSIPLNANSASLEITEYGAKTYTLRGYSFPYFKPITSLSVFQVGVDTVYFLWEGYATGDDRILEDGAPLPFILGRNRVAIPTENYSVAKTYTLRGYVFPSIAPSLPIPISNICFVKDTMVRSDRGWVAIQHLGKRHTFGGHEVIAVTKTVSLDEHLIEFEPNCFEASVPLRKITMTGNHCLCVNGVFKKSKDFKQGKRVPYNGEPLYNILLDVHGIVNVEGVACETLHPNNSVAHLFRQKLTDAVVEQWNRDAVNVF